jgi:DNA-binding LacI/PurR family transcriptional regulator
MSNPTMQHVAERAGVSTALVSLVMRNAPNVSDLRRERVLRAAAELGYRPNVLARNLASRQTRTVGVVLNDLHNPFFAEMVDELESVADEAGYRILLGNGRRTRSGEAATVETLLQFRVDGLVLVGTIMKTSEIEEVARSAAVTIVGRTARTDSLDSVNNDESVGARLAVDHLVALGHRAIAHIGGGSGAGARARQRGYERAMRAHGLDDEIVMSGGDFTEQSGYAAAEVLLARPEPPTAIFAANDLSAVGALDCVEDAGHVVPDDISIVGYDNTALAAMHHVSLTTIDQPRTHLGQMAMTLLLERMSGERTEPVHHVVAPELVVRATSGLPPGIDRRAS